MPNVTVYIRVGDMEAWRALPNKAQMIHLMLHEEKRKTYSRDAMLIANRKARLADSYGGTAPTAPQTVNTPDTGAATQLTQQPTVPTTPPQPAPTHLTDKLPENIRGAFVKADSVAPQPKPTEELPCCKEPSPCKHWVWNINEGDGYINTISGRKKITE